MPQGTHAASQKAVQPRTSKSHLSGVVDRADEINAETKVADYEAVEGYEVEDDDLTRASKLIRDSKAERAEAGYVDRKVFWKSGVNYWKQFKSPATGKA